jgi:hypothetical protein
MTLPAAVLHKLQLASRGVARREGRIETEERAGHGSSQRNTNDLTMHDADAPD